jgi:hypothetical protein
VVLPRENDECLERRQTGTNTGNWTAGIVAQAIERELGVRRESAGMYLRDAGISVRRSGGRHSRWPPPPEMADLSAEPTTDPVVLTDATPAKPATTEGVIVTRQGNGASCRHGHGAR